MNHLLPLELNNMKKFPQTEPDFIKYFICFYFLKKVPLFVLLHYWRSLYLILSLSGVTLLSMIKTFNQ